MHGVDDPHECPNWLGWLLRAVGTACHMSASAKLHSMLSRTTSGTAPDAPRSSGTSRVTTKRKTTAHNPLMTSGEVLVKQ